MTQEEKSLLLQDICARLSNWKWNDCVRFKEGGVLFGIKGTTVLIQSGYNGDMISEYDVEEIHPYLRPMSSMTDEELKELKTLCSIYIPTDSPTIGFEDYGIVVFTHHLTNNTYSFKLNVDIIDWLNAHYFDYRGLIEKGLALEAPEGMYK